MKWGLTGPLTNTRYSTVTCFCRHLNTFTPLNTLDTMDQGLSTGAHQFSDGLRERTGRADSTVSREALTATGEVEVKDKDGNALKTFGRTPDGTGKMKAAFAPFVTVDSITVCRQYCGG